MQVLRLRSDITARKQLSQISELLLEKRDSNFGLLFKIKHFLISKEILDQLLYKDVIDEKFNVVLINYCKSFIDFIKKLCTNTVEEYFIKILTGLFTDKTAARRDDSLDDYYGTHAKLINKLPSESQRYELICYLESNFSHFIEENIEFEKVKKEYNFFAHIYAQCARIAARNDQTYNDVKKYCDKTSRIIETTNITEPDLYHMIGMCYLDMANKIVILSDEYNNLEEIENLYYEALEMFNQTIWLGSYNYGIPKKMQTITEWLSLMFKVYNIESIDDEKLNKYPKVSSIIQEGLSLIEEKNSNYDDLSDVALKTFLDNKSEFEKICFLKDNSSMIKILNNRLVELKKNNQSDNIVSIYTITNAIVYSYSKKYYNETRKSSDLLIKAYKKDPKAVQDIKKVMEHLENVINLSEIQCASWAYKKWFSYSKFTGEPLAKAKDMAKRWLNSNKNNNDKIWIFYYLYITTFLLYVDENIGMENEVFTRRSDLR